MEGHYWDSACEYKVDNRLCGQYWRHWGVLSYHVILSRSNWSTWFIRGYYSAHIEDFLVPCICFWSINPWKSLILCSEKTTPHLFEYNRWKCAIMNLMLHYEINVAVNIWMVIFSITIYSFISVYWQIYIFIFIYCLICLFNFH